MRWKYCEIDGFERHEISDEGQVRFNGRPRKTPADKKGYRKICLGSKNNRKKFFISRLVCLHFCAPPKSDKHVQVAHYDGNKDNNHWTNLRWATQAENEADKVRHGRAHRGERHVYAKITQQIALGVLLSPECDVAIAKRLDLSTHHVRKIRARKLWAHLEVEQPYRPDMRCKLTDEQVAEIRASTESSSILGKRYGVTASAIRRIRSGKRRAQTRCPGPAAGSTISPTVTVQTAGSTITAHAP